jgi:hypothetical protein
MIISNTMGAGIVDLTDEGIDCVAAGESKSGVAAVIIAIGEEAYEFAKGLVAGYQDGKK